MLTPKSDVVIALACDCESLGITALHATLAASDELVAKALLISEVAQIARTEVRMRELLLKKWELRAAQAVSRVNSIISGGGSISSATNAVDKVMGKWDLDVAKPYGDDLERAYKLAREAGHKKANKQVSGSLQYTTPNFTEDIESGKVVGVKKAKTVVPELSAKFDLFDESAVAALQDDQMLWIGEHYGSNVRDTIRKNATADIIQGLGRFEAGAKMAAQVQKDLRKITVPKGFNGSQSKYFEGLAANAVTNARVRGQVRSFMDIGVTRYEIVNPDDARTSPICRHLNGKVFTVPQGARQVETEAGATNPDDIRRDHPWLSFKEVQAISSKSGHVSVSDSKSLADAGFALPPYHFRCRTTIDVSEDAGSYSDLAPREVKAVSIPSRKPLTKKPSKAATTRPPKASAKSKPQTLPTKDVDS